jgi:hypothetical protein
MHLNMWIGELGRTTHNQAPVSKQANRAFVCKSSAFSRGKCIIASALGNGVAVHLVSAVARLAPYQEIARSPETMPT